MQENIFNEMIATRRQLHTRPEEGWTEFETTWLVYQRLKELGYETILTGTQIINTDNVLGRSPELVAKAISRALAHGVPAEFIEQISELTGCAAVLQTQRPGPTLALRFDMDALCVQETDAPEHLPNAQGFCSEIPGMMHACGHDSHTALGLALARWIQENKDSLCGTIKLIFQPAEEGVRGATAIAASGFVDDVDVILGSHCGGKLQPREIGLLHSGLLASTKFDIRYTGKPSHAGNQPHAGKSALMAACSTAMMLVGIPRHGDGVTRVAVGKIMAGEGRNITPVHALIQAEVRGETAEINDYLCEHVKHIVNGNAEAYQVQAQIERVGDTTTLVECPEILEVIEKIARSLPETAGIVDLRAPSGSEDFTVLLRRVVEHGGRGAMFRWGCKHNGHHRSDFDIQDSETMPLAFDVFAGCILHFCGMNAI